MGGDVVLHLAPQCVPPLVGSGELAGHVLYHLVSPKVDARASHRHRCIPLLVLLQGDGEEVSPQLKVGLDSQVPLAQRDEGHDVLDPIWVQVLQLDLVVLQHPPKEQVRGDRESVLVEGHERYDVAIEQRRHVLMTRHEPLHRVGPPTEKATLDKALHACMGDVKAIPRLYGKQGWRNESFADGGKSKGGGTRISLVAQERAKEI